MVGSRADYDPDASTARDVTCEHAVMAQEGRRRVCPRRRLVRYTLVVNACDAKVSSMTEGRSAGSDRDAIWRALEADYGAPPGRDFTRWKADPRAYGPLASAPSDALEHATGDLCIGDDDLLYYTQLLPYEIRKYSLDGELFARIYRGNVPVKAPENSVRGDGETMIFTMPAMSSSIIAVGDSLFINTILVPAEDGAENHSLVDLYDVSGRYLATRKSDGLLSFKCKDRFGRIYAAEDTGIARVMRYRIVLNSGRIHGEAPQRKGGGS